MGLLKGGFKVVVCALLVDALAQPSIFRLPSEFAGVAEAATLPPGYDLPGFGGATATPRMLIIMDTSRSMASTPDMTKNLPLQDYDGQAESTMSPPICGEDPDTGRLPNSSGLSTTPGIPAQNTGAMQGTTLNLQCPAGQTIVQIDWAAYGKRENNVGGVARTAAVANFDESPPCSMTSLSQMRDTTALDGSGSCTDSMSIKQAGVNRGWVNITPKVENLCIGQESCSFVADDSLVGDPCYGTGYGKYALVSFRCSADPCPAGSGSKFCIAKKAMHRIVNDNAASNLEMSAGGYFQTNWSKYHPATNATYSTECVYDVIAKTTTTYNQGALKFSSSTEYGTVGTPALPGVPAMFACNPETFTGSNYATTCKAQPATHTCTKTFTYTADLVRFQHDDPMYRTVLPTGAPGSWTWGPGGDPADRLSDTPPHYFSNANSNWDLRDENRLYVPAADVGGHLRGRAGDHRQRALTAPPTHSTYPASCTARTPAPSSKTACRTTCKWRSTRRRFTSTRARRRRPCAGCSAPKCTSPPRPKPEYRRQNSVARAQRPRCTPARWATAAAPETTAAS